LRMDRAHNRIKFFHLAKRPDSLLCVGDVNEFDSTLYRGASSTVS
jgi:hypothetical protein